MKTWRITFTDGTAREVRGTHEQCTDTFLKIESRSLGGAVIESETFVLANVRSWMEVR